MDIKKFIKDNAIYSFENNIYDFIMKKDTNHWDDLYKDGIKGNPQNDFDNLKNFIDEAIKDRESCKTYLPILDLLSQKKNVQSLIEIGSGSGTFSLIAKKLGLINEVCLVEKSMTALLISQKLFSAFNEDALFVYADALDLPFKNY
ncbi:MAG TPA: hypothetical protein DIT25_03100, partial [Candidatus Moranbacteria bacterium]|nr:hypothetical protein [Candidatus Moranbacteria bacterium]